jgi:hypothetical protein
MRLERLCRLKKFEDENVDERDNETSAKDLSYSLWGERFLGGDRLKER